jgi:hypothetical protein
VPTRLNLKRRQASIPGMTQPYGRRSGGVVRLAVSADHRKNRERRSTSLRSGRKHVTREAVKPYELIVLSWSDKTAEVRCGKVCVVVESTAPFHNLFSSSSVVLTCSIPPDIPQPY